MGDNGHKPVYVLHGDDVFLRDQHRRELIASLVGEGDPQTCVAVFDATAELSEVLDELRTVPFLSPIRVVIIHDADAFVSAYRDSLERYLDAPSENGVLVLIVSSWPKNTRLYKRVAAVGASLDCAPPGKRGLGERIGQLAASRGKTVARDAASLLCEWIGEDLASLDAEIEKLSLYVGDRERIELADVAAIVTATAGPAAFDLTNAITAGDTAGALKALSGVLTARGEEFRTLGLLAWHLRKALKAREQMARGASPDQACRAAKVPPFQKQAFTGMLRRRDLGKLRDDFRALLQADLALKSGSTADAALRDLVVRLCS